MSVVSIRTARTSSALVHWINTQTFNLQYTVDVLLKPIFSLSNGMKGTISQTPLKWKKDVELHQ